MLSSFQKFIYYFSVDETIGDHLQHNFILKYLIFNINLISKYFYAFTFTLHLSKGLFQFFMIISKHQNYYHSHF